jgi:5-hydroxyisourate hydrolase
MSQITTHVLDTSSGRPAGGININLYGRENENWKFIAEGNTDDNGRLGDLLKPDGVLEKGIYKLKFETGLYFKEKKLKCFYPYVEIIFEIDTGEHYHIPLLLSPFGYTTYRGN